MLNLKVQREWLTARSTIGHITAGDSSFHLYSLEPETRHDQVKPRAIPAGTYPLTLRYSPIHGRIVPHVEDVPGFSEIEMHIGNYPKDTKGCTLVGKIRGTDFIGQSHAAFDLLFEKLLATAAPADPVTGVQHVGYITYVDPVPTAVTA
jgi:hypothetical protein